jgi:predicted nucleic acid-binding protein
MVFVDTSFFFALASPGDPDHERVREVSRPSTGSGFRISG